MGKKKIKHLADTGFVLFSWISVLLVLGAAMALVFFLLYHGFHTISPKLFFGTTQWWPALIGTKPVFDGIWPAMAGTLFLVLLSAGMAIPVGVAAGIYLSEYASDKMHAFSTFAVDLLAGIPSIVMGLFGFSMIIVLRRIFVPEAKTCIFLAAVCIAMLILPYMVRTTMNALTGIPENLRLIGPGLGLTQWQNIRYILLPVSGRGILSGVILSVGRAAEDTAVILLTGVVAQASIPKSLWGKFEALPFRIFYLAAEHRSPEQLNQAFGAALILLIMTGVLFSLAYWLQKCLERQWSGK
jgi:phosphate transport system permease protein